MLHNAYVILEVSYEMLNIINIVELTVTNKKQKIHPISEFNFLESIMRSNEFKIHNLQVGSRCLVNSFTVFSEVYLESFHTKDSLKYGMTIVTFNSFATATTLLTWYMTTCMSNVHTVHMLRSNP